MDNDKKNESFRSAFWVLGAIFTIVITVLIPIGLNSIVANDRIRAMEDTRIETKIENYRTETSKQFLEIIQRLVRIEGKIK